MNNFRLIVPKPQLGRGFCAPPTEIFRADHRPAENFHAHGQLQSVDNLARNRVLAEAVADEQKFLH
jgi:hypothetical protein